jgi:integrase
VRIYTVRNGNYTKYALAYYEGGKRVVKAFGDAIAAEERAKQVAARLDKGQRDVLKLKDVDAEQYTLAMLELRPLGLQLLSAVREYAEAKKLLDGADLLAAIRLHVRRQGHQLVERSVSEAVEELLVRLRKAGRSRRHSQTVQSHLRRFGEAFQMNISRVSARAMEGWLGELESKDGAPLSGRTRNNMRGSIISLFTFARALNYLPRDVQSEAEMIPVASVEVGEVGIFTPQEMEKLLRAAEGQGNIEALLWFSLGGFAGLRSAELIRLDWSAVDLAHGEIDARADITKTRQARHVPIPANLQAWLGCREERTGRIFPSEHTPTRAHHFAADNGVPWVPNGLRHSYGTYRLALGGISLDEVAREMGNSARMIETHYRAKAKRVKLRAQEWFGIFPKKKVAAFGSPA